MRVMSSKIDALLLALKSGDLALLQEGVDVEFKSAVGRDGRGELPHSLWETYSAMANTAGGKIVLGVKEHPDKSLDIKGVPDYDRVIREFWSLINNPNKVNLNLLKDDDVQHVSIQIKGNDINLIIISIPRAQRKDAPIYLNGNPFGGTYRRMNEGDFKCPQRIVERLLADRQYDTLDSRIFDKYDLHDVDTASLAAYRNMFNVRNTAHPFAALSDEDFLEQIGGYARDRRTGECGLTLAGILMFGKLRAILDNVSTYVVDYREYGPQGANERWIDRLTTDFSWSGNLFEFCRKTLLRLYSDLKVPFALNPDGTRNDETPAHVALREALVNTLIHADYGGSSPIVIVKTPNTYEFVNPGLLRLPQDRAFQGGIANSDCRNRTMQKMFEMIGYAEQAGSGFPKILAGCDFMRVGRPTMSEDLTLYQTKMTILRQVDTPIVPPIVPPIAPPIVPPIVPPVVPPVAPIPSPVGLELPPEQLKICELLSKDPTLSTRGIALQLNIRHNTAYKQIQSLKSKGVLRREGGTRGIWVLQTPIAQKG